MYCTRCGSQLNETALYCSQCGKSTRLAEPRRRISRPQGERKIAGVCAGFARRFDIDVSIVRIIWLAAFLHGVGIIAYLIAWFVIPTDYKLTCQRQYA